MVQTFGWSATGMAESVTVGTDVTSFGYTADDSRVVRVDPDGTTTVSLGGWYQHVLAVGSDVQTGFYSFGGEQVAMSVDDGTNTDVWYLFGDLLDSVGVYHQQGGVSVRQWYGPWGTTRANTTTPPADTAYTSQRRDPTGLYNYQARLYDPQHAQFLTPDTIIPNPNNPTDLNRHTYTRNNPTSHNDPTGHFAWFAPLVFAGPVGWVAVGVAAVATTVVAVEVGTAIGQEVTTQFPLDLHANQPLTTDIPSEYANESARIRERYGSPGFTRSRPVERTPGFSSRPVDARLPGFSLETTTLDEHVLRSSAQDILLDFRNSSSPTGDPAKREFSNAAALEGFFLRHIKGALEVPGPHGGINMLHPDGTYITWRPSGPRGPGPRVQINPYGQGRPTYKGVIE